MDGTTSYGGTVSTLFPSRPESNQSINKLLDPYTNQSIIHFIWSKSTIPPVLKTPETGLDSQTKINDSFQVFGVKELLKPLCTFFLLFALG